MCYIPFNLIRYRILGKDRMEPCGCGHFHRSEPVVLPIETIEGKQNIIKAGRKHLSWTWDEFRARAKDVSTE